MEKRDAVSLTDHILERVPKSPAIQYELRPLLTDTFKMIEECEDFLLVAEGPELSAFLLMRKSLFSLRVRSDPPSLSLRHLSLVDAVLTRSCEDIEENDGVAWSTTWRLEAPPEDIIFHGRIIDPHTMNEDEQFARSVALAAGWPLVLSDVAVRPV